MYSSEYRGSARSTVATLSSGVSVVNVLATASSNLRRWSHVKDNTHLARLTPAMVHSRSKPQSAGTASTSGTVSYFPDIRTQDAHSSALRKSGLYFILCAQRTHGASSPLPCDANTCRRQGIRSGRKFEAHSPSCMKHAWELNQLSSVSQPLSRR